MNFDPLAYGPRVAGILALDGAGSRLMPLASGACSSSQAYQLLSEAQAAELFKEGAAPEAALAGLWLYFSCLDESHRLSQNVPSQEGSFWHGILHRQEPDAGNAAYWFRRLGNHPVFAALRDEAIAAAARYPGAEFGIGPRWDPFAFI
ncbi:MAG: hypothetical protein NTY38_26630, partial [Acidobacteria bacterium]|nr:hypothetical protein [Acidobacteriota bacterium]